MGFCGATDTVIAVIQVKSSFVMVIRVRCFALCFVMGFAYNRKKWYVLFSCLL